jgi:hypothetical protein
MQAKINVSNFAYLNFQRRSRILKIALGGTIKRKTFAEIQCVDFLQKLNAGYHTALTLLRERLDIVDDEYKELRNSLKQHPVVWSLIKFADREIGMNDIVAPQFLGNARSILRIADTALEKAAKRGSIDNLPPLQWGSVRKSGKIVMEEIAYLSGRVDHLINLRNSIYALMLALGGIAIGAALTLLSIFVSILISNTGH